MDLNRYAHRAVALAIALAISVIAAAPPAMAAVGASDATGPALSQSRVITYCTSLDTKCPIQCFSVGARPHSNGAMITDAWRESHAFYGRTPEEIQQKFAVVIARNLSKSDASTIVSRLTDKELSDLATLYQASAPAGDTSIYRELAKHLDAKQLVRAAVAFGTAPISTAVHSFSDANVQRAFSAQMVMNLQASHSDGPNRAGVLAMGTMAASASQRLFMTLQEIYLDYRTDPVGSLGVRDALVETGMDVTPELWGAAQGGTWVGQQLNNLIETYAPGLDDAIGGTEYSIILDINSATTEFEQGQYEQSMDSLFGSPLGSIGDYTGDDDVGASYGFYEGELDGGGDGGGC